MKATRAEIATRLREEQMKNVQLIGACELYEATALRMAGERDAAIRKIDLTRETYGDRIEALHADLRQRTEERDTAQAEARKYAETRRLADDLQAELAAVKIALAESKKVAMEREDCTQRQMVEMAKSLERAQMLAIMVKRGLPAAEGVADYILSLGLKPCDP